MHYSLMGEMKLPYIDSDCYIDVNMLQCFISTSGLAEIERKGAGSSNGQNGAWGVKERSGI
jgi:hypothetical protein